MAVTLVPPDPTTEIKERDRSSQVSVQLSKLQGCLFCQHRCHVNFDHHVRPGELGHVEQR
jgi:hypothetical protein